MPRDLKHRMDEVARMTRWHRIAPPMGLGTLWPALPTHVDATKLLDSGARRPREIAAATTSRILTEDELRVHDPKLRFLRNLNSHEDYEAVRQELDV